MTTATRRSKQPKNETTESSHAATEIAPVQSALNEAAMLLKNARQTMSELRHQIELAQRRIAALDEKITIIQDELQCEESALEELRNSNLRLDDEIERVTLSVNLLAGSFAGRKMRLQGGLVTPLVRGQEGKVIVQ